VISYDLNYASHSGRLLVKEASAGKSTRGLASLVDVMLGNERIFSAALGFDVTGLDEHISNIEAEPSKR